MSAEKVVGQLKGSGGCIDIEWEIANFQTLSAEVDEDNYYNSPMHFFCNSSWYLKVRPNGRKSECSEGYIGVYLYRGDSGPPMSITYSLFLKKTGGREEIVNKATDTFEEKGEGWGVGEAIRRSEVIQSESNFLPSGVLTVICSLKCDKTEVVKANEVLRRTIKDCIISTDVSTETDFGSNKFLSDMKKLVVSGEESDVTVKVQDKEFRLHRAILGARTPVFSSMFKHEMKEKTTGVVSVDDCEVEIFSTFVHYLYTGSVDELSPENVVRVYKIADKYQVDELKVSCLDVMKCTLSVDTFCDIVLFGLQHDVTDVIEWCADFLSENMIEVMRTKEWPGLLRNNSREINELVLQALVRNSEE